MTKMVEKISTPIPEQETIIQTCPADKDTASIYTCIPKDLRRMWKLYEERPEDVKLVKDDKYASEFIIPASWIRIRPKRVLTEEQRKEAAERFARAKAAASADELE